MAKETIFVYSTLTSSTRYSNWKKGRADMSTRDRSVLIRGGSNVADKNLVTPRGVVTEITAEQLEVLEANKVFQRHRERGFVKVEKYKAEVEKVVSDMVQRDPSAPLVSEDYEAEAAAAPKTNKPKTPPKGAKGAPPPPSAE